MISLICLIVAAVCFGIAIFNTPVKPNMIAAGLFAATLSVLLGRIS